METLLSPLCFVSDESKRKVERVMVAEDRTERAKRLQFNADPCGKVE